MASNEKDDFENDWTFVDREGKVDIEVRALHHFGSIICSVCICCFYRALLKTFEAERLYFFSLWEISKTVVKQFTANARETTRRGNI